MPTLLLGGKFVGGREFFSKSRNFLTEVGGRRNQSTSQLSFFRRAVELYERMACGGGEWLLVDYGSNDVFVMLGSFRRLDRLQI